MGKLKYALAGCGLLMASSVGLAMEDKWKEKDSNSDGRISRAEFIASAEEHFSKMDTNNDSVLSENEFKEHKEHKKDKSQDKGSKY